eukprot:CAMPEP_0182457924 /NCGR_PEP_ID=MMETSP1319-20130603/3387_1 /TAXON_ID=172717 /ORGANISM="Bolidomonas pacifica, Strain RCC208" /LENGTH=76 /DNA_ID=CAMNT_0024656495 /DNA_START=134 /DNA_END=364 /DNA_ORIENTATION=+
MPFAGQDAWRKHPLISGLWKDPFPGLRPAAIAFAAFCVFDWGWTNMTKLQYGPKQPKQIEYHHGDDIDQMPAKKQH